MYDYGGLKTKLEWKVAVQWAGEAKQEMEESKQSMWVGEGNHSLSPE